MANPLRWFRRHQKLMMVFFGVGLMAVFGLGSVVSMINPSDLGVGRDNPVYANWKGGDIKRSDLDTLRFRHFQTIRFLNGLQRYAAEKKGDNFQSLAIPIRAVAQGQDFRPELVDEQLLSRFLLAQKAEDEGIVVGEGMIEDYLALVAGNVPISKSEMIAINKEANQGQAGFESVKRHLKIELAAQQMSNFTMAGIPMIPNPMDAIELYAKTSQRVECQVLPIPVDPDDVKEEPSASELRKLFEEGKIDYPDPRGIKPGFKVGKKVKVQYFVASRDTFLQNEINKLTDAEVQAEYEKLVEAESPIVMELVPDEDQPEIDDPNAADDDAAPKQSEESESGAEAAPFDDADPAPATSEDKGDGDGGVSNSVTLIDTQYVSTRVQESAQENAAETADEKTNSLRNEAKPAAEKTADAAPDAAEKTATQDEKLDASAERKPEASPQDNQPVLPGLVDEQEAPPAPKMRPKPLIDCAQQVKESLAGEATSLAIDDALKRAEAELGTYRMLYTRWKFGDEKTRGEEPTPIDFQSIADKYNLEFRETGLVDDLELEETEIGKIRVFRQIMGQNGRPQAVFPPLAQLIFDGFHDASEYDPKRENDMTAGAVFLYWLSEKADSHIPELEDVRDKVVEFWKQQQAFAQAMGKAEQAAEELNASDGKTLIAKYPEKGIQTGEFTWFNTTMNRPTITVPVGVTDPGDEFMKAVFSLDKYEATAVSNYPRNTVYVVQMMTDKVSIAETGKDYLENRFFKFKTIPNDVRSVSQWYGQEINIDWNEEFTDSMDLELQGQ